METGNWIYSRALAGHRSEAKKWSMSEVVEAGAECNKRLKMHDLESVLISEGVCDRQPFEAGVVADHMDSEKVGDDDQVLEGNTVWEEDREIETDLEKPKTGMSFESKELLHHFYKSYARKKDSV